MKKVTIRKKSNAPETENLTIGRTNFIQLLHM